MVGWRGGESEHARQRSSALLTQELPLASLLLEPLRLVLQSAPWKCSGRSHVEWLGGVCAEGPYPQAALRVY